MDPPGVFDGSEEWVDLTHAYDSSTIYWPTDTAGFQLEELACGAHAGSGGPLRIVAFVPSGG